MAPTESRLRARRSAVNHLAAIDPPLVGSFSPRAIFYMARAEILEIPVVGEQQHPTLRTPSAPNAQDVALGARATRSTVIAYEGRLSRSYTGTCARRRALASSAWG